jgi:hypothetical protein
MVPDRYLASRSESVQWGDAREDSSSKTCRRAPKRVKIPPMSAVIPMYANAGARKAGTLTDEPEPGSHHRPAIARPRRLTSPAAYEGFRRRRSEAEPEARTLVSQVGFAKYSVCDRQRFAPPGLQSQTIPRLKEKVCDKGLLITQQTILSGQAFRDSSAECGHISLISS